MILKRTTKLCLLSALVAGCLSLPGQPTSSPSALATSAAAATNESAPVDFDQIPLRTIGSLARDWNSDKQDTNNLVHVRGAVIDQRVGEYLVIRDDTGTLMAYGSQTMAVKLETDVDVCGRMTGDMNRFSLSGARFSVVEKARAAETHNTALQKPAQLAILTNAVQIRQLSPTEAGWEYPVKLRGVVTMSPQHWRTFVQDASSGIYVRSRGLREDLKSGDLVEIEGTTNPGWFTPIVVGTNVTVIGKAVMPNPQPVSLFQMATGDYDSQWVEAFAVVRGQQLDADTLKLTLSDRDGTFVVNIPSKTAPTNLMDAVIRIRGVCVSLFNNKRQIIGVELWSPSLNSVQVVEAGGIDPFTLPIQPIASLSQSHLRTTLQRRVRVGGTVTAFEPGKSFFIQDAEDGVQVFPNEKIQVKPGDRVEVVGYPALGDYGCVLRDAQFRVTGSGTLPAPKTVARDEPLDPQLNNQRVTIEALVAGDPEIEPDITVPLQVGSKIFKARVLMPSVEKFLPRRGSVVTVTGVYQVLADDSRAARSFQVVTESDKDIQILSRPSLWNLQRAMLAIGTLVVIACVALLWVLVLRRKVSEQTNILQQSEVKFRSLVEQSLVGVYVLQEGRFAYANPRMADIYGYSIEEFMAPTFTTKQTVYEEDWPIVEEQIKRRLSGEISSVHYAFRAKRKDGFLINVEVMGSLGEYNGKPAILGTAMDITERKVAEARLAEASNLLDTLMDNCPDFIYFKDRASRFVRYSKAFEKLFQLSDVKTLKGKTDFDFFLVEHAREAFDDEQEIIRSGKPLINKLETEAHADGRVTCALTTKMPWRDAAGNIIGTFGISKDVTALKETEAKLAYERDLFHALLENFPDVIYFKDLQSRFVRVSRSKVVSSMNIVLARHRAQHPDAPEDSLPAHLKSVEQFGHWLVGKTDFDTFSEERARAAFEDEQEIMRTGKPIIAKIERTPQADGKTTWCISTKMPWRDKDGQTVGTFGVSKDITALKEAEAELEAAHQRLIETSRLAGMAEVATDVLHNVGNVLNSVNVSCSLTIDRVKTSKIGSLSKTAALLTENRARLAEFFANDPRGAQIPGFLAALAEHFSQEQIALMQELEQLLKHIEHIKQIVAMQQSYAKVAGVIETINPTALVDDAIHINGAALTRHDVQLRCEFEPVPMIHTEKHRVLQILVNLIRNAKYALDESKRQDKILTIKLGRNGGDHVKIQVIDNGVGIPAENLTRIFGHGFTTRRNGHGFGLHSSALAIKELGGSLTAHSDGIGKGATFTLLLPEKPPTATQAPQ